MKVGLFFGSFNPIHIGHLILANYVLDYSSLDELWFVVSPQNPLKDKKTLLGDYYRLEMVELAIKNYPKLKASNIEFSLPKPSYTIDTLTYLKEKFPNDEFSILMGEDNLLSLPKWKNAEVLVENYSILVYPRIFDSAGEVPVYQNHKNITKISAPIIELSATQIRQMLKEGKNPRAMLPPEVFQYLDRTGFYL